MATVNEDEVRRRFEEWYAAHAMSSGVEVTTEEVKKMRVDDYYGHERKYLNGCWDGYQAGRADAMEWRPIDSEPKYVEILVFDEKYGVCIAKWHDGFNYWPAGFYEDYTILNPTGWMPLPEPPK